MSSSRPATGLAQRLRGLYGQLPAPVKARLAPAARAARRVRAGRVSKARLLGIALLSATALVLLVLALALAASDAPRGVITLSWLATLVVSLVAGHQLGWLGRPSSYGRGGIQLTAHRTPTATEVKEHSKRFADAARVIHAAAESVPEVMLDRILPPPVGTPWVAIVVPAYNEKRFLAECLRSVQQQTFGEWECVIVDDASTDLTAEIALKFIEKDDRFSLVQHTFNQGLAAARNTGLAHIRAPLVTFLDGDDLMMAGSLADRVATFQRHLANDLAGVYCGAINAPEEVTLAELEAGYERGDAQMVDIATSEGVCPFAVHMPLLRTDLARHLGAFDETFTHGAEDYDFWIRVLRAGYHFQPSGLVSVVYRQRGGSMVREKITEHYQACQRILDKLDLPWDDAPSQAPFGPLPVIEPLGVFQRRLILAERAIRWTGLAVATGTPDAALTLLKQLEPHVPAFALRHLDIEATIRKGVKRAWGAADDAFVSGYAPQIASLANDVTRYLTFSGLATAAITRHETVDASVGDGIVMCPASLPQAVRMADLVEATPELAGASFLTLDDIAGDQGAHSYLVARGLNPHRLRAVVNLDQTVTTLVVADPSTVFAKGLAERAEARGVRVLRLADVGPDSLVDESASTLQAWPGVAPADLLAAITAEPGPRVAISAFAGLVRATLAAPAIVGLSQEERRDLPFDSAKLRELKDAFKGERCVIIGNGPSLNKLDLSKLRDVATFAVNGIFLAADKMGFDPTFYVVEDTAVMADNTDAIRDYKATHKLFPAEYRRFIGESDEVTYFRMNRGFYAESSPHFSVPRFSTDAAKRVYCGQSVTIINLQLAYHFGFTEVALIGMDFSYNIPTSVIKEGLVYTSTEADENHFHPDYFGPGKKWKDPKLDRVLINYEQAKLFYEADGRRIVNATVGGNLHVYDRADYDRWLG